MPKYDVDFLIEEWETYIVEAKDPEDAVRKIIEEDPDAVIVDVEFNDYISANIVDRTDPDLRITRIEP